VLQTAPERCANLLIYLIVFALAEFPGPPALRLRRDKAGYYWITDRPDEAINISGHRTGTVQMENALVAQLQ